MSELLLKLMLTLYSFKKKKILSVENNIYSWPIHLTGFSLSIHPFIAFYVSLTVLSMLGFLQLPIYMLYTFFCKVSNISFQISHFSTHVCFSPPFTQWYLILEDSTLAKDSPVFVLRFLLGIYDIILSNPLLLVSILTF